MYKKINCATGMLFVMLSFIAVSSHANILPLPQQQITPSGIEYITGGIGDEENDKMNAVRKDYDVHMTFAHPKTGSYISGVKVTIKNDKNVIVLDRVLSGPHFFINLEKGKYIIEASFEGNSQIKTISTYDGHAKNLVYYFKVVN